MRVLLNTQVKTSEVSGHVSLEWTDNVTENCQMTIGGYVSSVQEPMLRGLYELLDFLYGKVRAE